MTLDRPAIAELYRSHGHIVLRRARALMGSAADAEEALHEVFASLLRTPELQGSSAVAWLYQATTHFCLNQLRNRRTGARLIEARHRPAQAEASEPRAEALAQVQSLLATLPTEVAAAVVYHHLDGMTHQEVAELLGCSRRQVGYLLSRASDQLAREEKSA
jgi:RNA polymerase sigma-70 factor (ECF subfamily)